MAKRGMGTSISKGAQVIGYLTSIGSPEKSAETIETTTLDVADNYKTYMQGLIDGGEVAIAGFFETGDAGILALNTAVDTGATDSYTITFPAGLGATWTFTALVTGFQVGEANKDDAITFEATLKVTGKPNLGTTASGGLTAASFVQTAGDTALTAYAITPTFANGTFNYTVTYTTQTAYKVKMTAANHTIQLYVDGVLTETLASGTSSTTNVAQAAVGTKKIDIIVYEAGKTPKTYSFMVARTA